MWQESMSYKKRYGRIESRVGRAADIVRGEGEITVYRLAFKMGMNPEYFKRTVVPVMLEVCVDIHLDETEPKQTLKHDQPIKEEIYQGQTRN